MAYSTGVYQLLGHYYGCIGITGIGIGTDRFGKGIAALDGGGDNHGNTPALPFPCDAVAAGALAVFDRLAGLGVRIVLVITDWLMPDLSGMTRTSLVAVASCRAMP